VAPLNGIDLNRLLNVVREGLWPQSEISARTIEAGSRTRLIYINRCIAVGLEM
jgi:hypothetical protein